MKAKAEKKKKTNMMSLFYKLRKKPSPSSSSTSSSYRVVDGRSALPVAKAEEPYKDASDVMKGGIIGYGYGIWELNGRQTPWLIILNWIICLRRQAERHHLFLNNVFCFFPSFFFFLIFLFSTFSTNLPRRLFKMTWGYVYS